MTDSVRDYVMRNFSKNSFAKAQTVMVDMLNYGAAAQENQGYKVNDLANNQLTDAQKAYGSTSANPVNKRETGTNYYGSTLSMKENLVLTLYFKNIDEASYAIAEYTDWSGEKKTVRVESSDFYAYNATITGVRVKTLAVGDGDQLVTVTVYDAEGNAIASGTDSMNGYAARQMETQTDPIYEMIARFTASANAYLAASKTNVNS